MAANPAELYDELSTEADAVLTANTLSFEFLARRSEGFYSRYGKRAFDLALGIPLLLLSIPIVAVLACAILVTSGRPVFYVARRVGKDGSEFEMLKLRTMVRDAELVLARWRRANAALAEEYNNNFKLKDDPRITPLGRFLRRTSLDELPQLWNVVRGEMSLVGPRPYYSQELELAPRLSKTILRTRPGLTGPWQVGGRNEIVPMERIVMDARYATNHALLPDITILMRTARQFLRPNGY